MLEPASVALQAGFLAVLFLFVLWVARSALRDLRRPDEGRVIPTTAGVTPQAPDATGMHHVPAGPGDPLDPRLIVERAPGHVPGMEYDIGEGAVLGRGDQAEIRLEDPFASSSHARLIRQGPVVVLEDLGSTNGTFLNEELVTGPQPLHRGDRVRIGDSEFTYVDA